MTLFKESVEFESGWRDFTSHWWFEKLTIHVCFVSCYMFLFSFLWCFFGETILIWFLTFFNVTMAETCRGISLLVKSQTKLRTVLLLCYCTIYNFHWLFLLCLSCCICVNLRVLYFVTYRFSNELLTKCRDLSDNMLYGDIPFSISKLKQLELL